jgi:hypothetical protein
MAAHHVEKEPGNIVTAAANVYHVRMIVIPAKAGIQRLLKSKGNGFPIRALGNDSKYNL